MTAPEHDPGEDRDLQARLDRLKTDLGGQGRSQPVQTDSDAAPDNATSRAMSLGMRVMSEFVASVVVGGVIGWQGDVWLHTSPLLLLIFLGLGTAAGFWSVYRLAAGPTAPRGK